ncbi:hypothetical protein AB3X52_06200 [Nocardioides sp. DS6]|uniref:DUF3592 domain-containing protein n=1 Tax=Nocardioides eburneus TaxID=3231482 RepID=A0ABV3SW88_9ACTN
MEKPSTSKPVRPRIDLTNPGKGPLIAAIILILIGGAIPIARYVDTSTGHKTVTATVDKVSSDPGRRMSRRGKDVEFTLPDGTTGSTYLTKRANYPDPGDRIELYRDGDYWRSTEEFGWGSAVGGALAVLVGLLMIVGWFKMRSAHRRATEPDPALAEPDPVRLAAERDVRESHGRGEARGAADRDSEV